MWSIHVAKKQMTTSLPIVFALEIVSRTSGRRRVIRLLFTNTIYGQKSFSACADCFIRRCQTQFRAISVIFRTCVQARLPLAIVHLNIDNGGVFHIQHLNGFILNVEDVDGPLNCLRPVNGLVEIR